MPRKEPLADLLDQLEQFRRMLDEEPKYLLLFHPDTLEQMPDGVYQALRSHERVEDVQTSSLVEPGRVYVMRDPWHVEPPVDAFKGWKRLVIPVTQTMMGTRALPDAPTIGGIC